MTGFIDRAGPVSLLATLLLASGIAAPATTHAQTIAAAVLPTSGSSLVGATLTAFATIAVMDGPALSCVIKPPPNLPLDFSFQTTDPLTNELTGTPNTPVDIQSSQSFVFDMTPLVAFEPTQINIQFDCANTAPATVIPGLNTFTLSAAETLPPNIISIAATADGDGVIRTADDGTPAAFSVAAINVGAASEMTVSADTNSTPLPIDISLCPTDPVVGTCLAQPAPPPIPASFANGANRTFTVFLRTGTIPADATKHRVWVRFTDTEDVERGSTSVAVESFPLLPQGKLGVMGDSIAAGTHSDEMCGRRDIVECVEDQGGKNDRPWSYATGDREWSIASRLGYTPAQVLDASDDGEEWKDALQQAQALLADPALEDVFIGLGANDICQPVGHQYTGDLDRVEGHIDDTLSLLTDNLPPGGRILWASTPNVVALHGLMRDLDHNYLFENCQATWDIDSNRVKAEAANDACDHFSGHDFCDLLDNTGDARDFLIDLLLDQWLEAEGIEEGPCGKVLSKNSTDQDRAEALAFNLELNRLMAAKALEYSGRNGVAVHFNDRLFQVSTSVGPHHVSRFDCYHPSRSGQKKLADEWWSGFRPGAPRPGLVMTDDFETPAYCSVEVDPWAGCWSEIGDDGDPATGFVRVNNEQLRVGNRGLGIQRGLDLGSTDRAWLSFVWQRLKLDKGSDYVTLDVSANGGATWQEIDRFRGDADDFGLHRGSNYDLSAFATSDMRLRLLGSPTIGDGDKVEFDHFKVLAWGPAPPVTAPVLGTSRVAMGSTTLPLPPGDEPPVVLAGVPSAYTNLVTTAGVNVTSADEFAIVLNLLEVPGNSRPPEEDVGHLALPPGVSALPDGSLWEAGRLTLQASGEWQPHAFTAPFRNPPALFATIQNAGAEARMVRIRAVSQTGFETITYEPQTTNRVIAADVVGYIAIESPTGSGRLETATQSVPYELKAVTLSGGSVNVFDTQLWRVGGEGSSETIDVLRIGRQIFAQDVTSSAAVASVLLRN